MYFWQLKRLKHNMAARPLSEREVLPYLLVYITTSTAIFYIPEPFTNVWDALSAIFSTMLGLVGSFYIYMQNGGANGEYFLQRYLAIGWVVTFRWLLIFSVTTVILLILLELASLIPFSEETTWYDFLYLTICEAIVYQRIGHHVRDVAQRSVSA